MIEFTIKYVSEYIITSYRLTDAYDKLLKDDGYLKLLEKLKLEIFEVKRWKRFMLYRIPVYDRNLPPFPGKNNWEHV